MPVQAKTHAFTLKATGIARALFMPIQILVHDDSIQLSQKKVYTTQGLFDTGASATVITKKVVDDLQLKPTGITTVNTASESAVLTETFLVDIYLKQDLCIRAVNVTLGKIVDGIDCLIGMDIITLGDFSISNKNGNTCLSFRIPSLHEVDYVKNPSMTISDRSQPVIAPKLPGRNDLCYCGSGKKFKNCHGPQHSLLVQ